MKIQVFREPVFHIVIDDYLPETENAVLLKHIVSHEKDFVKAALGDAQETNVDYRSNLNLHMDMLYSAGPLALPEDVAAKRAKSPLLSMIDSFIQDERVLSMLDTAPAPLNELRYSNYWSTQVSRYGDKDHYHWHYDRIPWDETRLITLIYYVHSSPKKFEGGNLVLTNGLLWEDTIVGSTGEAVIEPKNNRLVLFDSRIVHTVKTTKAAEKFEDGRFSVNVWIGKAEDFE
jgi:Rps23 Pro-64 3,4-dihydroxylase Tpa1-like proline 4-hydroxylase